MQLRDRVQFQRRREDATDKYGNPSKEPAPFGDPVWANMRETTGKERVEAGRVEASRTATLRVRSSTFTRSLKPSDIATARGEDWDILGIAAVGDRRAYLDFLLQTGRGV